jgi:hypothetical protein
MLGWKFVGEVGECKRCIGDICEVREAFLEVFVDERDAILNVQGSVDKTADGSGDASFANVGWG